MTAFYVWYSENRNSTELLKAFKIYSSENQTKLDYAKHYYSCNVI